MPRAARDGGAQPRARGEYLACAEDEWPPASFFKSEADLVKFANARPHLLFPQAWRTTWNNVDDIFLNARRNAGAYRSP